MADCAMLTRCGFIAMYLETQDLACGGFMISFCRGPQQANCKRLAFRQENGCAPDDDMLPTGQMMPKSLRGPH